MQPSFKKLPIALLLATASSSFTSLAQADLIFSEYIEGSSNNKALELTNLSASIEDLSNYSIELYSNGSNTINSSLLLTGSLEPNKNYVIANPSSAEEILNVSNTTSSVTYFNGNDVLLLKKNNTVIDRIGQLGNSENFGKDITLVRKSSVLSGDSNADSAFDPGIEWESFEKDTFAYLGDNTSNGGIEEPPVNYACGDDVTYISSIQGEDNFSSLEGNQVAIEAIVIATLQTEEQLSGFFVQEEDSDVDNQPNTSEGIFIYNNDIDVQVGDQVLVAGEVDEFYDLTQINEVTQIEICASQQQLPATTLLSLPLDSEDQLESFEGMLVTFNDVLTVNEVYNLGRYGEFTAANGRRYIPTEIALPGEAANAVRLENSLNSLIIDDGFNAQNPETIIYPSPKLDAYNTLRVGDTVSNLTGVINYSFGDYKLLPTTTPIFDQTNPRTNTPLTDVNSQLRIASFNVLNYFNGDGLGSGFPTDRGADTASELERQETKLVSALDAINADIVGLMELENDGFDELSAIASLVKSLNLLQAEGKEYQYVVADGDKIGDDAISVGIIYRPTQVSIKSKAQVLDSTNSPLDDQGSPLFIDDLNRPVLIQEFQLKGSKEIFTLAVNHFKSKGASNCSDFDDCDQEDGQGAYNTARTNAAKALTQWLSSNALTSESSKAIILGDLNAYSKEDPLTTIENAGYISLKEEGSYSYNYKGESGNLDHALVSENMAEHVVLAQEWHINTDEPRVLDYNQENKTDSQIDSLYSPTPDRSSDHDPVIIDFSFDMNEAPEVKIKAYRLWFWWLFISESSDSDGHIKDQTWNIGTKTINKPWAFVSTKFLNRHNINDVTLTVVDNEDSKSQLTKTFRTPIQ